MPNIECETGAFRKLAVAIIERAILDLSLSPSRYSEMHRQDAYEFLMERLWDEECMWNTYLGGTITRPKVRKLVKQKMRDRR